VLRDLDLWAVVNAAGYASVDAAEREPEACRRANVDGPAILAQACATLNIALLTFSSHLVFDGVHREPYVEYDAPAPLCIYGQSKAEAEARVLEILPSALVVRTAAFFGPWDQQNFVTTALRTLAAGRTFVAANDAVISPSYLPDLVNASLDLLIDGENGVWHLANEGALTWEELARSAAALAGVGDAKLMARPQRALGYRAPRPEYSVLSSARGILLPAIDDALSRYVREWGRGH
jgi:dTDP-4-dehydrorhamnose reductase